VRALPLEVEGLPQGAGDAARWRRGAGRLRRAALQHRELVATQPHDAVGLARALAKPLGHLLKQRVAGRMAKPIVHRLA
jgi:hypothetical protein